MKLFRRHIARRFFALSMLLAFLLANIGLTVYTHTCSISGTQKLIFFDHNEVCGEDQHPVTPTSCCENQTQDCEIPRDAIAFENSCCSTQADYILLDVDTHVPKVDVKLKYSHQNVDMNFAFFTPKVQFIESVHTQKYRLYHTKPRPKPSQDMLQVFII